MKKPLLAFMLLFVALAGHTQTADPNKKYSPQQLKADLDFVKQQLFDAHANPFTELSKAGYEKVFDHIADQITDSMTATGFFKFVRPAVAYLSDEHSQISIATNLQTAEYKNGNIFLPFNLSRKGNIYVVNDLLAQNTGLQKRQTITMINETPVAAIVNNCVNYVTGFPAQRIDKALLQFGYLYTLSKPGFVNSFDIKTADGKTITTKGTTLSVWMDYIVAKAGQATTSGKSITYTHYGNAGYINCIAFNARNDREMDSLKRVVAGMFGQMKTDGVKDLFIDVSRNGGGNSTVGDMLTDFFYDKPYLGYQCNWKRSNEYLTLIKSWGIQDQFYASQPIGKVIHFDSEPSKFLTDNPVRFKGKVYVIVGDGTFSSAIMFATTIKDNHIATLIGQTPKDGHPNHFGEIYNTKLPNTKLDIRFGVKEWIRPAGKTVENILTPDIIADLNKAPHDIIKEVLK